MELGHFLAALRARWIVVAFLVLTGIGAAWGWTDRQTPLHSAQAQVFVAVNVDDPDGLYESGLFAQQRVKSYAQLVSTPAVTSRVIAQLGLTSTPEALVRRVSGDAPLDTVLLNISATDRSASRARDIANATTEALRQVVAEVEQRRATAREAINLTVVKPATRPASPASPQPVLNLTIGALAGLLVALIITVLPAARARGRLETPMEETEAHPPQAKLAMTATSPPPAPSLRPSATFEALSPSERDVTWREVADDFGKSLAWIRDLLGLSRGSRRHALRPQQMRRSSDDVGKD